METEDLYAAERENLIEGDPIAVVDELLELRRMENRARELLRKKRIYLTNTRTRQDFGGGNVDRLALGRMEQRYVAEIHELEAILGIV